MRERELESIEAAYIFQSDKVVWDLPKLSLFQTFMAGNYFFYPVFQFTSLKTLNKKRNCFLAGMKFTYHPAEDFRFDQECEMTLKSPSAAIYSDGEDFMLETISVFQLEGIDIELSEKVWSGDFEYEDVALNFLEGSLEPF